MTNKDLIAPIRFWNDSNELFKGLQFESMTNLQYVVECYSYIEINI